MSKEGKGEGAELCQFLASTVYRADPLGRFLIETLGLREHTVALAAFSWGLIYIVVLPALFGSLWSSGGYLGSLDDWHAQLLLVLVFPAVCAFYLWQAGAVAGVYAAILPVYQSHELGTPYVIRRGGTMPPRAIPMIPMGVTIPVAVLRSLSDRNLSGNKE